jgi:hypothetical protein
VAGVAKGYDLVRSMIGGSEIDQFAGLRCLIGQSGQKYPQSLGDDPVRPQSTLKISSHGARKLINIDWSSERS